MPPDSALIAELQHARQRVRDLESQLIAEGNLAPLNELARILIQPLFRDSNVYLTLLDHQGRALFLSHTDPDHTQDELLGESVLDFVRPEDLPSFREALERVFREGCQTYVEAQSIRGGRYGNHLAPVKLEGRVIAVSNFSENVTERRRIEQHLQESELRWRSLAENVPDSVVLFSPEGKLQYANRLRNITLAQAQQMSYLDFALPEYRDAVAAAFEQVLQTGKTVEVELQDSIERNWYLARLGPMRSQGSISGVISIARNITRRKEQEEQLREREARLQFLLDKIPAIAWTIDTSLRCTSAAGAGLAQLGLTPETAIGINLYEFFGLKAEDQPHSGHYRALAGESVTLEFQWGGRTYHALFEPLRDPGGAIVGASGVAVDITERSTVERQIRSSRDELERRVAERTDELKTVNRSLLKERRVLQRLLDLHDRDRQLVAYEIHDGMVQDMAGALMFFEAAGEIIRKADGKAAENYEHGAQLLRTSIQEARRLIDGLRPPVLEEYGLIDAIGNHVEELRHKFQIEVEFEHDVKFVRLSPVVERAIYRIVQESLNNLALHSGTRRAFVSMHQLDNHVDLIVRDWGHGFDPAGVKPKRFGLLSIRDRARLLGGEAEIVTAPQQGTTIKVLLPVTDILLPGLEREGDLDHPPSSSSVDDLLAGQ